MNKKLNNKQLFLVPLVKFGKIPVSLFLSRCIKISNVGTIFSLYKAYIVFQNISTTQPSSFLEPPESFRFFLSL